jgi:hypothetical protein
MMYMDHTVSYDSVHIIMLLTPYVAFGFQTLGTATGNYVSRSVYTTALGGTNPR